MRRVAPVLVLLMATLAAPVPSAQHQLQPVAALRGAPALELALRKLDTVGTFMMTTAHPDDENNAMLAYYGHGKGMRTTLVTATRGEGGQNEIGPELFEALAVLRTEELLAAHRYDGAEQYFTRAVDFGFSFTVEETLEKWGKQEILGDYVRMIRTIRPRSLSASCSTARAAASIIRPRRGSPPRRFARRRIRPSSRSRSPRGCAPGRRRSSITRPASAAPVVPARAARFS